MPGSRIFFIFGGILLVVALVARVSWKPNHRNIPRNAWILIALPGVLALIVGACGGFYSIYMFTDRVKAHNSLKPGAVTSIEILPGRSPEVYHPLVRQKLVVKDRQQIDQLVAAMAAGQPWAPNHPRGIWHCIVRLDDGIQKHSYWVSATTNNGVLISLWSEEDQGLLYGVYREDSLKAILESIAAAAEK